MRNLSTGLHKVKKRLRDGDRWYVYAYRGGPCIHKQDGSEPEITTKLLDAAYAAKLTRGGTKDSLDALLDLFRDSNEFNALAPSTQREYRLRMDQISRRMGRAPLRLFDGKGARRKIIEWRDELSETPRAADRVVGMLSTLFEWGIDRELLSRNPAKGIGHLHKANRADLIWEDRHWRAVEGVPDHIQRVLQLGALTGLRISDLLSLQWGQVTEHYIAVETQKTGGEAIVPMHQELADFLSEKGEGAILRNSLNKQWTADGFQSSWRKAKPQGFDRKPHDLRGTFATRLMIAGFTDTDIANVMGWTAERIAAIRSRYVDRIRVAKARAEQIKFTD